MIGELTRYRRYIAGAMVLTGDRIVMNMINSFLDRCKLLSLLPLFLFIRYGCFSKCICAIERL